MPHSPLVILLLLELEELDEDEEEEEALLPQGRGPAALGLLLPSACPAEPAAGFELVPQGMPLGTGPGLLPSPCSQRGAPGAAVAVAWL